MSISSEIETKMLFFVCRSQRYPLPQELVGWLEWFVHVTRLAALSAGCSGRSRYHLQQLLPPSLQRRARLGVSCGVIIGEQQAFDRTLSQGHRCLNDSILSFFSYPMLFDLILAF